MKKFLGFLIFVGIIVLVIYLINNYLKNNDKSWSDIPEVISNLTSSCNPSNDTSDSKEEKENKKDNKNSNKVPDGTPSEWINLFKIENGTVEYSYVFFGNNSGKYYYLDGICYLRDEEGNYNIAEIIIFDFTNYYSKFSFNEAQNKYYATDLEMDGNTYDVTIYLDDLGRISKILTIDKVSESLQIETTYDFYAYGETERY